MPRACSRAPNTKPYTARDSAARALSSRCFSARRQQVRARFPGNPAERTSRFGVSVKKALGSAVVRNRIRRRIREILRRNRTEIPSGWDIVIHPRRSVAEAPFAPLEAELFRLLRSIAPKK